MSKKSVASVSMGTYICRVLVFDGYLYIYSREYNMCTSLKYECSSLTCVASFGNKSFDVYIYVYCITFCDLHTIGVACTTDASCI